MHQNPEWSGRRALPQVLIGSGVLEWVPSELFMKRYAAVQLLLSADSKDLVRLDRRMERTIGTLLVVARDSKVIGSGPDLPIAPPALAEGVLGRGQLFFMDAVAAGINPLDGREENWLDPKVVEPFLRKSVSLLFIGGAA